MGRWQETAPLILILTPLFSHTDLLIHSYAQVGPELWSPIEKISDILSSISRSYPTVKAHMALEGGVVEGIMRLLEPKSRSQLDHPRHARLVLVLLKVICHPQLVALCHPTT